MTNIIMMISGISGALAVVLGAFASHGLKKKLTPEMVAVFKTGVDYQFYHSFALALVGLSLFALGIDENMYLTLAFACFIIGILLFCGSLYLLALTRKKIFGPITPLGGLFFIAGWMCFTLHWINR